MCLSRDDKVFSETTLLDWVFKGFVGVLAWLGIRLHNRVDSLEKEKASNAVITELKETMKEHREETRQSLTEIRAILLARKE